MGLRRGVLLGVLALGACDDGPPGRTFYERNIEPILMQQCAGNTSGCHSINIGDPYAFAAGNLDVTSFDNVQKRRDLLAPFGAYQQPLFLIKAVAPALPNPADPNKLSVEYRGEFLPLDVLHGGGSILDVSSDAYFTLQTWMENGATANGLKPASPARTGTGDCSKVVPSTFVASTVTGNASFNTFKNDVQPILSDKGCNASTCHGAPQSDFYITCGDDDNQIAFNFSQAWSFVNSPVDDSQILRVPLAVASGGRGHTGGDQFSGTDDSDFTTVRSWAMAVGKLDFAMGNKEKEFFEKHVQPVLLQRGCAFQACHSPAATNDFKLRSGTQGFFSAVALSKNYDLLKHEFMAFEFPDARRGRAVAKGLLVDDFRLPGDQVGGIAHRGGPVLETPSELTSASMGADPSACTLSAANCTTPDAWNSKIASPFCTVQQWLACERAALGSEVTPMTIGTTVPLVFVERPSGQGADRLELDTHQGNADLMIATGTFGADFGRQLTFATPTSLLTGAGCTGLAGGDIQAPDVAPDGTRVAFAHRPSSGSALSVWVVRIGGGCTQVTPPSGTIHNFDPAWSPDGNYLVFASTRGKTGPTQSKKRNLPQSDLWRVQINPANDQAMGAPEQMTFLSSSEIAPQFMREGRVTMTTEKASEGFYQLAGRRINWDLTDYHPLLAQRKLSPYASLTDLTAMPNPSIGYDAATDIREGNDGNFMMILSDVDPNTGKPVTLGGGGALGIFNRSIGPFEQGRSDPGYLPSVRIVPGATGRDTASAYRSPVYMPDGQIMASYYDGGTGSLAWRLVSVNVRTGERSVVLTPPGGRAYVDAVLAYKYPARSLYLNRRQLVFGGTTTDDRAHGILHMPDAPMVFTLLTGNLRRGRPVDKFRSARFLVVEYGGTSGRAELADDGSVRVRVPAATPFVMSLQDGDGAPVVKMGEEHQLGPGEAITLGIRQTIVNAAGKTVNLFDAVCGGCHGSVSGRELDAAVSADALTGASVSASQFATPVEIGP